MKDEPIGVEMRFDICGFCRDSLSSLIAFHGFHAITHIVRQHAAPEAARLS